MNITLTTEARSYLEAVRARAEGLSVETIAELLTDLEQHLAELIGEDPGPLSNRLGTPVAYAAELASSAGWPSTHPRPPRSFGGLVSGWRKRLAASPFEQWWMARWPDYRPGWWIGRALLVGFVMAAVNGTGGPAHLLWILPLVVGSVAAGRQALTKRGWGVINLMMTLAALVALMVGYTSDLRVMPQYVKDTYLRYNPSGVVGPNGVVETIYAYDADGQPIDVFLYDQNGSPIATNWSEYQTGMDATGVPFSNFYPSNPEVNAEVIPHPAVVVPELPKD